MFGKISLWIHVILTFLAFLMLSAIYMYILNIITLILARPRNYTLEYLVRHSHWITSSSHIESMIFFSNLHSYFNYNQQWPRNCMNKYICLRWYPFLFTSSSHSLQVNIFISNLLGYFNYSHFLIANTNFSKANDLPKMVIWYFPETFQKFYFNSKYFKIVNFWDISA